MIAMIEINLLPAEFRPREKTNLGLIATVAIGLLVFGGVAMVGFDQNNTLAGLETQYDTLGKEKADWDRKVKYVRGLEKEIAQQKDRQNTIIDISQSKIMWSLKLEQFSMIMKDFPGFWIQRLVLTKTKKGEQALRMECSAAGSSLRKVAAFRERIKTDPNFFYHFSALDSSEVRFVQLEKGLNISEQMDFTIELPLRKHVVTKKKKKGAKKPPAPAAPPAGGAK
jgi:Tfp pilus assembly protein PilN